MTQTSLRASSAGLCNPVDSACRAENFGFQINPGLPRRAFATSRNDLSGKIKHIYTIFFILIMTIGSAVHANPTISNLVSPASYFTGREEEIATLTRYMSEDGKTVAIVGMSGMGKTQLARQYSFQESKKYNIVWFIDADIDLSQQFLNLAQEINNKICQNSTKCKIIEDVKHIKDNVMSYLNSQKNWLLVFDNITIHNSEKIRSIIPQTHNGHIIICSQDKSNFELILPISIFNKDVSERLVSKINSNLSKEQIAELTSMFSGYPILLAKGSLFLLNNKYLTVEEYKNILKFVDTNGEIQKHIKLSIEKLSLEAQTLLLQIALMNNRNFSKGLLAKLHNNNYEDLSKNLYTLIRFALIEDKGFDMPERSPESHLLSNGERTQHNKTYMSTRVHEDNKEATRIPDEGYTTNNIFEMHDVVKNTILNLYSNAIIKKTISNMAQEFDAAFPLTEAYQHHILLHEDDTIRNNLEILLQNAEKYHIDIYDIIKLREELAYIYSDQLDYPHWKEVKEWLDRKEENHEINFHDMTNEQKSLYASYIVYQGKYELFAVGNVNTAKQYLYKALDIAKQINNRELQFTAFMQLAQIAVHSGDIESAKVNIINTEQLVDNSKLPGNSKEKLDLWLLCYVKARLLLLEGKYQEALIEVNRSIQYLKPLPKDQFTDPPYLMKARIWLNLGNYDKAYKIANKIYNQSKKLFNYDHRLQSRILTLLADAENNLKMPELALEHILLAKKLLNNRADQYNDPLTMIVEGDIMAANANYAKAIELYSSAEQVFNERYKEHTNIDIVSILYSKLAKAALKNHDKLLYRHYISKHEYTFGVGHYRTQELYKEWILDEQQSRNKL